MTNTELARWIVEHGADKPAPEAEIGVPLYLPVPEIPKKDWEEVNFEVRYEI